MASTSLSELQRRYTERARLKAEEKDLVKMIDKTKAQLTQLQVEALEIKSRIRTTTLAREKEKRNQVKKKDTVGEQQEDQTGETDGDDEEAEEVADDDGQMELDLSANHVLEKMMRGNFSTNDVSPE